MIRLKLMPLVPDFGEFLDHPLGVLCPMTQLIFTRDNRIFEQFPHFPESDMGASQSCHIQVSPLPPSLQIIELSEEQAGQRTRQDAMGCDIMTTSAKELKKLIVPEDTTAINKAIKAYIDQLPDDTSIIMEWT
jgi:hypothetical protein